MEIAGCFVGQIKAAWLVGKSGILVWMVVASIATQANNRTARDREIIMVSRLLSVSLSRSPVAGRWLVRGLRGPPLGLSILRVFDRFLR